MTFGSLKPVDPIDRVTRSFTDDVEIPPMTFGVSSQFFVVKDCSVKEAPHCREQEQTVG
jgi:hypothetical protein